MELRKKRILIGLTGSVASTRQYDIIKKIKDKVGDCEIRAVLTPAAELFNNIPTDSQSDDQEDIKQICSHVYTDKDEWAWKQYNDPVLHIDLSQWADILIICPLSSNSLAKIAGGICDNLLTCIVKAWEYKNFQKYLIQGVTVQGLERPIIVCPAMNTKMWEHPFTSKHLKIVKEELGFIVIDPIKRLLACGDFGMGGLANRETIAEIVEEVMMKITYRNPLEEKKSSMSLNDIN